MLGTYLGSKISSKNQSFERISLKETELVEILVGDVDDSRIVY